MTNRLNQDCIENFFCQVRSSGGSWDNPNASQFRGAYRALAVQNLMVTSKVANCEADLDEYLRSLSAFKPESSAGTAAAV